MGMVWEFIENNALVRHFKAHWLYYFVASDFGWIMSNFMTTPVITAIAVVFLVYGVIAILLDKLVKIYHSKRFFYYAIHSVLLIVCILIASHFWSALVYACDKDNPCKKTLVIGTATIEVVIDSNSEDFEEWGDSWITLLKKGQVVLTMITPTTTESYAQKIEIMKSAIGQPYISMQMMNLSANQLVTLRARIVFTFILRICLKIVK